MTETKKLIETDCYLKAIKSTLDLDIKDEEKIEVIQRITNRFQQRKSTELTRQSESLIDSEAHLESE